jgi:serine/threonine protein phosphatase PrpC
MKSFMQKLDFRFLIAGEMIEGRGEDCFYSAQKENSAIAAVFDGCGGLGSRRYQNYREHTGAYMASRAAGGALRDWYQEQYQEQYQEKPNQCRENQDPYQEQNRENQYQYRGQYQIQGEEAADSGFPETADQISAYMSASLDLVNGLAGKTARIFGTMVRDFPTTAAAALVSNTNRGTELQVFWAGDSRVYLIDRRGLAQLTRDDVEGKNAMSNLRSDGALTNVVAADQPFTLHTGKTLRFEEDEPYMVLAATDGCFGYLPTPMDFEAMVLSCLLQARTPAGFRQKLEESISETAGDDYTLAFMSFGYGDFRTMQGSVRERAKRLRHDYMDWMEQDPSLEMQEHLWEEYRTGYERFL